MARKVSRSRRFEVFARDGFACQYCGSKAPGVLLEVDHVLPVSKGGTCDIDNLTTSCFDCNRGKGSKDLTRLPQSAEVRTAESIARAEQAQELRRWRAKAAKQRKHDLALVASFWRSNTQRELSPVFLNGTVAAFVDKLGVNKVMEYMSISISKFGAEERAAKYFCGICWSDIKGKKPRWA